MRSRAAYSSKPWHGRDKAVTRWHEQQRTTHAWDTTDFTRLGLVRPFCSGWVNLPCLTPPWLAGLPAGVWLKRATGNKTRKEKCYNWNVLVPERRGERRTATGDDRTLEDNTEVTFFLIIWTVFGFEICTTRGNNVFNLTDSCVLRTCAVNG